MTRQVQLAAVPKLLPPPEMSRGIRFIAARDGVRVLCTLLRHVMNASSARMKDENSQQIGSLFLLTLGHSVTLAGVFCQQLSSLRYNRYHRGIRWPKIMFIN
jgi:hypothetical protein